MEENKEEIIKKENKKAKELSFKYGNMSFEDFWEMHKDEINEQYELRYRNASKFKRLFLEKKSSLLEGDNSLFKTLSKIFFEYGQLQMVSNINMSSYKK
jgi:hypothetical protein